MDQQQEITNKNITDRKYTYDEMRKCFAEGLNRGIYVACLIKREPMDYFPHCSEYLEKTYGNDPVE